MLGVNTFQTCQAQCADGGTDGGTGGMQCQQCAGTKCTAQVQACATDMTAGGCAAWLQCTGQCLGGANPDQCETACDNQFPNAKAKYEAIYACSCTSCTTECAAGNPCGHVPDGGP
jgi:hypothetical protein